jgi:phosphoribosyl 1,2-cyclic phosphodiesterase
MNKILVGALVTAAFAGVVWYLCDEEGFMETFDEFRDKADDALGKAKDRFGKSAEDAAEAV